VNLVVRAPGLFLFYTCSATGAHNLELVGTPDQGPRKNGSETQSRTIAVIR
jgi:hypothetical protein